MDGQIIPQASLFLGIIPALILLYIALKGYEGQYKDKYIYLSFVAGIILGFIAALVQSITVSTALLFIFLLAVFNQLFKTIILNIKNLQQKRATPIYGISLGLGFGSAFTPFLIFSISMLKTSNPTILILIIIASIGIILFHGATGAYIGYGIYAGKLTKFLVYAILLHIPFSIITDITIIYSNNLNIYLYVGVITTLAYGTILFSYILKKIMPQILHSRTKRTRSPSIKKKESK